MIKILKFIKYRFWKQCLKEAQDSQKSEVVKRFFKFKVYQVYK